VRGVRLSLGEIEALLNQQPGIRQSHVLAMNAGNGDPRLVAFIVPAQSEVDPRQMQIRLQHILPMHLLPERFVLVEELPLTPSGDVDGARLPIPELGPPADDATSESRGERFLLKLWREILETDSLGPEDDFFLRGGNEARAEAMLARIESSTRIKIAIDQLREHSRLRDLAQLLDLARPITTGETTVELRPGSEGPIFLIPAAARTSLSSMRYVTYFRSGMRVIGLEYPSFLPGLPPAQRVPALADYFIEQIRSIQPEGPYLLAGNCMGGLLVYEAALHLTEAGERVERLATIDCTAPLLQSQSTTRGLQYYLGRFIFHLRHGVLWKIVKSRASTWFRPVRQLNMDSNVRRAIKYLWDAKSAYRAQTRFNGSALVILTSFSRDSQRADGWMKAAPNAQIQYIDEANHLELFQSERALTAIGRLMNEYMEAK